MPSLSFEFEYAPFIFSYGLYIKDIENNPEKSKLLKSRESKNLGLNFEGYEIDI
jgi:hypothetical protein